MLRIKVHWFSCYECQEDRYFQKAYVVSASAIDVVPCVVDLLWFWLYL